MRAFILVDDADSMSEFSDELVILLTEPEEENEDFSSVLSSLPSLSSGTTLTPVLTDRPF